MGLALEVGTLADLNEHDPVGAAEQREQFEALNAFLAARALPRHREPEAGTVRSISMWGYSGLHYLRRVAAHLALTGLLPAPGDREAAGDPLLQRYLEAAIVQPDGGGAAWRVFDHLIIHSDAEGFYLPQDFARVLVPEAGEKITGGWVGSASRLLEECRHLAEALQLADGMDPADGALWMAADAQGSGGTGWQRYGVESYTCACLLTGAKRALETGAALVFC